MSYALDAVLDRIEGPPTLALVAIDTEIDSTLASMKRSFAMFLHGPWREPILPWRCPSATLARRAKYGGRKGASAIRRLKDRGDWEDSYSRQVEWARRRAVHAASGGSTSSE